MRICAEFLDEDSALEGHHALLEQGVPPESIDVRSAYPLPESAYLPQRSHPMLMRNLVRLFWVLGATAGFSFLAFTQLIWPIHTAGHPLVALPINFILTYECGMITGLIMTIVFLFLETRRYRNLNPPHEEDLPVERGNIAIVVDGPGAERAESVLKSTGARSVVKLALGLLAFLPLFSGCSVKMRDTAVIKSTEAPQVSQPPGTLSMPGWKEQKLPAVLPLGYFYPPELRVLDKKELASANPKRKIPEAYRSLKNPIKDDLASRERGRLVYAQNCIFCHGPQGEGGDTGAVGQVFLPKPANLRSDKVKHYTDGELFFLITMGPSTMPSFANRLSTRERFDLIRYVRTLQK